MMRVLVALVGLIVAAALVFAGWFYRPWSEYSPAEVSRLADATEFVSAFRSMDEIFPFQELTPAAQPVTSPRTNVLDIGAVTYQWEGATKSLDTLMQEAEVTGVLVLKSGVVVGETYRLEADAETRFTSWSVAKSFVATLIGMALHEGLIDNLDDPAAKYAPQYADSDLGATSLRHLLMMSAGLEFNEDYFADDSDIRPLFFNVFINGRNVDREVGKIRRDRVAGADLHYTSPNTQVLAAVARGVYGGRLSDVVQAKLWEPLNMAGAATWSQNVPGEKGMAIGYCCLNARLEEYARFGLLYAQDGLWNGARLLPRAWVEQATTPRASFMEPDATYPDEGYGLHFWVPRGYDGESYAAGVYGQYIWIDRRSNTVVAVSAADPTWGPRGNEWIDAFRALVAAAQPPASQEDPS